MFSVKIKDCKQDKLKYERETFIFPCLHICSTSMKMHNNITLFYMFVCLQMFCLNERKNPLNWSFQGSNENLSSSGSQTWSLQFLLIISFAPWIGVTPIFFIALLYCFCCLWLSYCGTLKLCNLLGINRQGWFRQGWVVF